MSRLLPVRGAARPGPGAVPQFRDAGGSRRLVAVPARGAEELPDIPGDTRQQALFPDRVPHRAPHPPAEVAAADSREPERGRDRDLGLVEVCDVVDEAELMARVDEPEAGRAAKVKDRSVGDAVEGRVRGRKALVDDIAPRPVGRVVPAAFPRDTSPAGVLPVGGPDPGALTAAELLHGPPGQGLPG